MNLTLHHARTGLVTVLLAAAAVATLAPSAAAHPLGNFTVNHYTGLTLRPDRIDALVVVDRAEIAAAQERRVIDTDRDDIISAGERRRYAADSCSELADQLRLAVDSAPLPWTRSSSASTDHPGEAGLKTSRLQCTFTAPADLGHAAGITVRTAYDSRRIGWREITARGDNVTLAEADVPARSATDELRRYPQDPLATPLDQRSATLRTEPGSGTAASALKDSLPSTGTIGAALQRVSDTFNTVVGARELTVPVGLLALLLAVVLGASHAVLPGHGKTIMAAYLAGRRGTPKDAVTVGATVTLTHTAGVLILGLALPLATHLAGETILTWLGVASGLLVTTIGLWLLRSAILGKPAHHGHSHSHGHHRRHTHHHHSHSHSHHKRDHHHHDAGAGASPAAAHVPGHRHPTEGQDGNVALLTRKPHASHPHSAPEPAPAARSGTARTALIGMGIAGGLVPSPSALVVLLGAIALGRTAFGVMLVIAYGLGMAATLTLAGLLLVRLRDRIESAPLATSAHWAPLKRVARYGPVATSALVLLVGLGLTLRAAAGPW